jgi:hypothetical protein
MGKLPSMPTLASRARSATVAIKPIRAQIIQDGKYDPRMFREGAELHPVSKTTEEPISAYKERSVRVPAHSAAMLGLRCTTSIIR